jgi:hypothetical protein
MHSPRFTAEQLVRPSVPSPAAGFPTGAFVVCPAALQAGFGAAGGWVQDVYRMAYEQAREALMPSAFERRVAPVWN